MGQQQGARAQVGPLRPDYFALHTCSSPACCRAEHLFEETMQDRWERDPKNRAQLAKLHETWSRSPENRERLRERSREWYKAPENRERFRKRMRVTPRPAAAAFRAALSGSRPLHKRWSTSAPCAIRWRPARNKFCGHAAGSARRHYGWHLAFHRLAATLPVSPWTTEHQLVPRLRPANTPPCQDAPAFAWKIALSWPVLAGARAAAHGSEPPY